MFVQVGRLKHHGSSGGCLVLDGAHTADSAAALATLLREAFPRDKHPLALVLAMAADKVLLWLQQPTGFCRNIG